MAAPSRKGRSPTRSSAPAEVIVETVYAGSSSSAQQLLALPYLGNLPIAADVTKVTVTVSAPEGDPVQCRVFADDDLIATDRSATGPGTCTVRLGG